MKRDMELVRSTLMKIEAEGSPEGHPVDLSDLHSDRRVVEEHLRLLDEAGYLEARNLNEGPGFAIMRLTWEGHEFIAAARNDTIWQKAKDTLKSKGVEGTVDVLKDLLLSMARAAVLGAP